MTTTSPYQTVLALQQHDYTSRIASQHNEPALIPRDFLNILLLLAWLALIPNRGVIPLWSRYFALAGIAAASAWSFTRCTSLGLGRGVGIGLNCALVMLQAVNFTVLHDVRLFRRRVLVSQGSTRNRSVGVKDRELLKNESVVKLSSDALHPRPDGLGARFLWALDLMTSFHGHHWSWSQEHLVNPNQAAPRLVAQQTDEKKLLSVRSFIFAYLWIDALKTVMLYDPYFLTLGKHTIPGYVSYTLRLLKLPPTSAPGILHYFRLLLSFAGIYQAINLIASATRVVFVNLLGAQISGIGSEPWMNPSPWGDFHAIFEHGLKGFWGEWWHQTFRLHFVSIANALTRLLFRTGRGTCARLTRLFLVFFLSGAMHACGSYTLFGRTRPWAAFAFFALQPVGIVLEHVFALVLRRLMPPRATRKLYRFGHGAFSLLWLTVMFPLLADDLASGGMWVIEPIPVSFLYKLAPSSEKSVRSWWCWGEVSPMWHQGRGFWDSGFIV